MPDRVRTEVDEDKPGRVIKFPKKRELVFYYILRKLFREGAEDLGDMVITMSPIFGRKQSKTVIKFLLSIKAIEKREGKYFVKPIEDFLNEVSKDYVLERCKRNRRDCKHLIEKLEGP